MNLNQFIIKESKVLMLERCHPQNPGSRILLRASKKPVLEEYCQMYVERKCRRLGKIKSHLPCAIISQYGMCWQAVRFGEQMTASIRNPKPNDMNLILKRSTNTGNLATGQKAKHNCTDAIATKIRELKSSACLPQAPCELPGELRRTI